jgi:hypothetical protein
MSDEKDIKLALLEQTIKNLVEKQVEYEERIEKLEKENEEQKAMLKGGKAIIYFIVSIAGVIWTVFTYAVDHIHR